MQAAHGPHGVVIGQLRPLKTRQSGAGLCKGKVPFCGGDDPAFRDGGVLQQNPVQTQGQKAPIRQGLAAGEPRFPAGTIT